jgi:hypothetical protein
MRQENRWHPCLLPDNYQRKLRQDLTETDAAVASAAIATRKWWRQTWADTRADTWPQT